MDGYIQTTIGVIVSIIIYLLGYRQTIGAKQERIQSSNKEIEKILIRRIVNDNYNLSLADIRRLLEGKARDFKVKVDDLYKEEQMLNSLYTRVIETDFITKEQREKILSILLPIYAEVDKEIETDGSKVVDNHIDKKRIRLQSYILSLMALTASILGALISAMPLLKDNLLNANISKDNFYMLLITIVISLLAIFYIAVLKRYKDSQSEVTISSNSQVINDAINFEKEVSKVISKNYKVLPSSLKDTYDYYIFVNNKKVLFEIKAWGKSPSAGLIGSALMKLSEAVIREGALEGILIIKEPVSTEGEISTKDNVKIMTINELKSYLESL
ncbi:hypothetical protein CN451_24845 [Priestia megaterium]|uniref:hypothetical protein n=1 Tax=Priestia megaterium TaxID=1404 RepID=UPI000BF2DFB3|nr:hypothetical protein [Priestia megaterium]PEX06573.1 hypothetical protein CN451_24845 [Priestia megaterium]